MDIVDTDSAVSWSFDKDFARNAIKNSLLSHSEHHKNNCIILVEGPDYGINGSFESPEKRFSIFLVLILLNQTQNFVWFYILMLIILISLLMEKKFSKLKTTIKLLTFQLSFVSEVFLMDLVLLSLEKLRENVYDFSFDYSSIDKSDKLNIHKSLMTKNNIRKCSVLWNKCLLYYWV